MACFLVLGSEGIVVSLLTKVMKKEKVEKLKLKWLNMMLWGGTILTCYRAHLARRSGSVAPFLNGHE